MRVRIDLIHGNDCEEAWPEITWPVTNTRFPKCIETGYHTLDLQSIYQRLLTCDFCGPHEIILRLKLVASQHLHFHFVFGRFLVNFHLAHGNYWPLESAHGTITFCNK